MSELTFVRTHCRECGNKNPQWKCIQTGEVFCTRCMGDIEHIWLKGVAKEREMQCQNCEVTNPGLPTCKEMEKAMG